MREIKFRAWIEDHYEYNIDVKHGRYHHMISTGFAAQYDPSYQIYDVEQFTGIQDSEGVDIYENDIVRYWLDHVQEWSPCYIVDFGYVEWGKGTDMYGYGWASGEWFLNEKCTICGNIHQHAHLLEE